MENLLISIYQTLIMQNKQILFLIIVIIILILISCRIIILFKSYFQKKGENLATKENIKWQFVKQLFTKLSNMNFKIKKFIISYVPIITIISPLIIYFFHFHNGFAYNSIEWNNFSSFINPFITLLNVFVFYSLTISINKSNKQREDSIQMPKLIFKDYNGWEICNIGNGEAMNIKIAVLLDANCTLAHDILIKVYSLGNMQNIKLQFIKKAHIIIAFYENISGGKFVSIVGDDDTTIIDFNKCENTESVCCNVAGVDFSKKRLDSFLDKDKYEQLRLFIAEKTFNNISTSTTTELSTIHPSE